MRANRTRKGSALLEFTLVGIPLIFTLISIFEISRAMWNYHTLAFAMKEGTRYVVVHGFDCTDNGNTCAITVGQVAQKIRDSGIGLDPALLRVTLTSQANPPVNCNPLSSCLNSGTTWPVDPDNRQGQVITITGNLPFQSALAMFWPGANNGVTFPTYNFSASSTEFIQF
jgi:Flp pilus assembly protein TadG